MSYYEDFRVITTERAGPLSDEDKEHIREHYNKLGKNALHTKLQNLTELNYSRGLDKFERAERTIVDKLYLERIMERRAVDEVCVIV